MELEQNTIKLAIAAGVLIGSASLNTAVHAATTTDNLIVLANVEMTCTVAPRTLNFATYDPTSNTDNDASAVITSTCTHGGSAKITLAQGAAPDTGSSDADPRRQLISGTGDLLAYSLYQNSDRNVVWGNTADTGLGFTAVGGDNTTVVFGRIESGLAATSGSYSDSVTVTITY